MVSKVTLSFLVLCLCISHSLQAPDHNRTRREDKPAIPGVPGAPPVPFNIQDFQGFLNVISNWIPGKKDKVEATPAPAKE